MYPYSAASWIRFRILNTGPDPRGFIKDWDLNKKLVLVSTAKNREIFFGTFEEEKKQLPQTTFLKYLLNLFVGKKFKLT